VITPQAVRSLAKSPARIAERILEEMEKIAADPFGRHPQAKRLIKSESFRVRVGDWRALYTVDTEAKQVVLADVLHRSKAYR